MITSCFFMVVSTQDGAGDNEDNAMYEDKFRVRSARLLEQFCILKQLHHI